MRQSVKYLPVLCVLLCVAMMSSPCSAAEKFIALSEAPQFQKFAVSADGSKLYMAGGNVTVLDAGGRMVDRLKAGCNKLVPLPDGWFVLSVGGNPWTGHLGMVRPDGSKPGGSSARAAATTIGPSPTST